MEFTTGVTISRTSVAAGLNRRTPGGWRAVEEFAVGHGRLCLNEWDANGAVTAKGVEEVFVQPGNARGPVYQCWRTGPRVTGEG